VEVERTDAHGDVRIDDGAGALENGKEQEQEKNFEHREIENGICFLILLVRMMSVSAMC